MKLPHISVLAAALTSVAAGAPAVTSADFTDFDVSITHSGTPGTRHALELSTSLTSWTVVSESIEGAPGAFTVAAMLEGSGNRQFARVTPDVPPPLLDWMRSWPVNPGAGEDIPFDTPFMWTPIGAPGTAYQVELFRAVPDGEGGWSATAGALLRQAGLAVPAWEPPAGTLHTGGDYIWRVTARLGTAAIRGREVAISGPGRHTAAFDFSTAALPRNGSGHAADWAQLLDNINEMQEHKTALQAELAANPLVQQQALYDELFTLLGFNDTLKAVLTALLTGDTEALTDPDTVLQGLTYLQKLAEFASRPDKGKAQTPAQRAMEAFAARLGTIIAVLENAADRAAQLDATLEAVEAEVAALQQLVGDPAGYLLDLIKDKLMDKLTRKLTRMVGEKAAGAMLGAVADIIALGQAAAIISELDDLCDELNRGILEAIACAPASQLASGGGTAEISRETPFPPGCVAQLSGVKYCFAQTPGGLPHQGHFVPVAVPFSDGTMTKDFSVPAGTTRFVSPHVSFLPAAINCQPGMGPCILYCRAVITCPGSGPGKPLMLFAGVIRCP